MSIFEEYGVFNDALTNDIVSFEQLGPGYLERLATENQTSGTIGFCFYFWE